MNKSSHVIARSRAAATKQSMLMHRLLRSLRSLAMTLCVSLLLGPVAFAEEDFISDPEEKARHAHEMSASDVIYQQEDFKALYYQNQKIIELLKEMRDELHNLNMRQAKET